VTVQTDQRCPRSFRSMHHLPMVEACPECGHATPLHTDAGCDVCLVVLTARRIEGATA
jgi:hypothetical protein